MRKPYPDRNIASEYSIGPIRTGTSASNAVATKNSPAAPAANHTRRGRTRRITGPSAIPSRRTAVRTMCAEAPDPNGSARYQIATPATTEKATPRRRGHPLRRGTGGTQIVSTRGEARTSSPGTGAPRRKPWAQPNPSSVACRS
ncbi:hypothetical protein GCM10025883_11490 [Mobilicoccus caccae]|uniref:Uncharacterized protein n=1 Tax=Mobilicoccus caccae TaxID=1859295 RepID=A0ABQ6IQV5_9MICO|nr:hypothetical protein GCM10025883_11490 [Mobilicoccus caccae]